MLRPYLFVILSLLSSFAAQANDPVVLDSRPAVIFIPGYLGSFLRDKATKKRIFVSMESALGKPGTLSLFQKELQTPAGPELELDGVMDYVPALVTKVDVYGSMLAQLHSLAGVQVIPFAWDWRRDPFESVQRLGALIAQLKAHGAPRIDLVAHSGGGWLASYYAAYGTQPLETARANWSGARNLHKIVLLGVPFQGGMPLFRELQKGSTLPLMRHLLPPDTMASFPSIYCTAPLAEGHLLNRKGEQIRGALAQPELWKENHLGLLARTDLPADVIAAREAFLAETLASCQRFMGLLQLEGASPAPSSLSIFSIVGAGSKTLDKVFLIEDRGQPRLITDADHPANFGLDDSLLYVDGDGVVPQASSTMPAPMRAHARKLVTRATHQKLTTEKAIQQSVLEFLKN